MWPRDQGSSVVPWYLGLTSARSGHWPEHWVLSISEFDHRLSLWVWPEKDCKISKGVKFCDERNLSWKARLPCIKEQGKIADVDGIMPQENWREKQSVTFRERPATWSPLPLCVMLKPARKGAQDIWLFVPWTCWLIPFLDVLWGFGPSSTVPPTGPAQSPQCELEVAGSGLGNKQITCSLRISLQVRWKTIWV